MTDYSAEAPFLEVGTVYLFDFHFFRNQEVITRIINFTLRTNGTDGKPGLLNGDLSDLGLS